jgi:SAM-dependent methyltransferase
MYERLLRFLRCPECHGSLAIRDGASRGDGEVTSGVLCCNGGGHMYPVLRGIPRMWSGAVDTRTRASFSHEWRRAGELGGRTWGMTVDERVDVFFLRPLRMPGRALRGKVVLDAGCGTASQSVAYAALGMEVIALDLSEGIEQGPAYRELRPDAPPDRVHFIQGDLRRPPLAPGRVDVIHAVGVLHHTADTRESFRALRPLLRDGGIFYVWLYRREPYVTALIDAIRAVTTRIPPAAFAAVADAAAPAALVARKLTTALHVRGYPPATRAEAAHALIDTFGSPHRHSHSLEEVAGWYRAEGFESIRACNEGRRGFGVCGRLAPACAAPARPAAIAAGAG